MLITTKDNIKALLGITSTSDDAILVQIANVASSQIENYLGRSVESTSRTEYFDVERGQHLFQLRAYPVASSPAIVVYNDESRLFTTVVSNENYTALGDEGQLIFDEDYELVTGPKVLKVVYTGGLASSQASLESNYPDLEMATRIQAVFLFENRKKIGVQSESVDGSSASRQELMLLKGVKEMIEHYRA